MTRPGATGSSEQVRARGMRLRAWARGARQAWAQVFGIPDYERYLAHHAAQHPGEPVLSRREFFAQAIDRKYGRSGPRC